MITDRLREDMKSAMKAGEKERLSVIRMALAAIKQREIDGGETLDDSAAQKVVEKLIKQRKEAAQQFRDAGRDELADKEVRESEVLAVYMPAQLSEAEIDAAIDSAIATSGASEMKDMGKVMGVLSDQLAGKADMSEVSLRVRTRLAS